MTARCGAEMCQYWTGHGCACDVLDIERPTPVPDVDLHWDHDLHGPVIRIWPDRPPSLDPDCDCPPGCRDCEAEGIER